MDCVKAEEQFSAYFEDELGYRAIKQFEAHLADCQHCRHEFALFRESLRLLREIPEVQPSPEFDLGLQLRLADTPIEPTPFWEEVMNAFRVRPAWAFGGVTLLLVMLAGYFLFQDTWQRPSPGVDVVATSTPEMRSIPSVTITRPEQLPLATPRSSQLWTVDYATSNPRITQPQRISQNYILQTVNYTASPMGGGL